MELLEDQEDAAEKAYYEKMNRSKNGAIDIEPIYVEE